MEELKRSIKRTYEYGLKYGVKYNLRELEFRLIGSKTYSEKEIKKEIADYFGTQEKILIRNSGNQKEKLDKARRLACQLEKIFKNILFIGVTGSVAAGNPPKNSDIDVMIITKKNSLWLTRLMLRIYVATKKIPHRRFGETEKTDEFCFNLWLEEDSLLIHKSKQNLRNSMDLILMKPILNKGSMYEKFIKINDWANKFTANGYAKLSKNIRVNSNRVSRPTLLIKIINELVYWPQVWYMRSRISNELVNKKWAYFHPNKT